jgi:hypothetical protein
MAAITPAVGGGMVIKVNGTVLKGASFERPRSASRLPIPTSGMTANADGEYEVPNTTGLITREIMLRGPYDTATPFHGAPYHIRPGKTVTVQVGMISSLLTPSINFKVERTTDRQDVERLGEWEALLIPAVDSTDGYYTEAA